MHEPLSFPCDDAVTSLGGRFLDLTLPKSEWTHSAHIAATLFLIHRYPELDLRLRLPRLIRTYNEQIGVVNSATTGYHETITQASVRAVRAFVARDPSRSLHATCNALLASQLGKSDWLLEHWTREHLFSVEARMRWCEPDIRVLPF